MATYTAKALQLPINGVSSLIELKDAAARAAMVGGTHYRGVTTSELSDGATTSPIAIGGESYTPLNGDIVVVNSTSSEYIFSTSDNAWHLFGDLSDIAALGFENDAVASITPEGTLSGFGVAVDTESGKYVIADNATDAGSITPNTGTADDLDIAVGGANNDTLVFDWTPGVPLGVTLPTFTQQDIVTGVSNVTQPTFSGTAQTVVAAPAT